MFDGDIDVMFGSGDLEVAAVFENEGKVIAEVKGWFTEPTDATVMYNVEIEAQKPRFEASTAALAAVTNKMRCTVQGKTYIVEKVEKTGIGITVLSLKTTTT